MWLIYRGDKRLKALCKLVSYCSYRGLRALGFHIEVQPQVIDVLNGPGLVVCNHLSYMDVLILSSIKPQCFVTSVEMKETPFLGWLTQLAGCVFVERRNKQNISQEIFEMTSALQRGLRVTFFPEATSTNGESVLRFRTPLFQSSIDSGVDVVVLCLNYKYVGAQPVSLNNRDVVCWYGDMPFFSHCWEMTRHRRIVVELITAGKISPQHVENNKELALAAQQKVAELYLPFKSLS